jgi:uncharacterized phiE125 gp8 family phage protein
VGQLVPIGTHPGLVLGLVDADLHAASVAATGRATRLFLRRTDNGAGDVVVASLRNATGGGGSGIAITLGDGVDAVAVTGDITGTEFYLRVSSADGNSQNLTGWFDLEAAAGVASALTTLVRVKEWLKITGSTNDTLITNLIAGESARIQRYLRRYIVQQTITAEIQSGHGREILALRERPVTAVTEVREDGVALASSKYELDGDEGILYARTDGNPDVWTEGSRNFEIDYTAGYASPPDDLVDAATIQVADTFRQTTPGGDRLGVLGAPLDAGGSPQYITPAAWAPGVLQRLALFRELRLG